MAGPPSVGGVTFHDPATHTGRSRDPPLTGEPVLPNQFLVSVADTSMAAAFYGELLGVPAEILSPRYATFELTGGVVLALWSGDHRATDPNAPKGFEIGFLTADGDAGVRRIHEQWVSAGVEIVEDLHEDVFGTTFVAADLDGNRLRVAPTDG